MVPPNLFADLASFGRAHTNYVNGVAFSPDGATLASASWDNTIILWDVNAGKPRGEPLRGHAGAVNGVAFSPDGAMLASASWDKTVILWDVNAGKLRGHKSAVNGVAFSPASM